jgi:hypothetical protein
VRAALALAALAVIGALAVALLAFSAGAAPAGTCGAIRGGGSAGNSQLRFLDAREDHATFTFGQSADGQFQPPSFELTEAPRERGRRVFTLRLGSTSMLNPDGTPSFEGPPLVQPDDRALREVRFVGEQERSITWRLVADGGCPRLLTKRYTQGTFPRAQIVVLFDRRGAVTIEPATMVGPQVWVSGIDFAPNEEIEVELNEAVVTARSGAEGAFEKALYVFDLPPGAYRIGVRDQSGDHADGALLIPVVPIVPDLVPRR